MTQSNASDPVLPGWARAADGLTVVLAVAAASVAVFGGIRIGAVFSMSTPWRALVGLIIVCGLRHYLVPTPAIYHRVCGWLRPALRPTPRETASDRRLEALHIVGLWCLAVAQPIFDVVGRSPEFFVAHDTRPGDLLALVVCLCLGGPAACLLAIRLAGLAGGPRWRRRVATGVIASLAAAVALAVVKPLSGVPGGVLVWLAALGGAGAASVYRRVAPARLFATLLASAALVVPAVFLFTTSASRLLAHADDVTALDGVTVTTTPPVVVVVFDQFQLAALLDRDGNIDRAAFPHFAALADEATWFRNASAVAGLTPYALPAVLTGMRPSPGRLPVAAAHPANLFTLLGGRYRMHVEEPLTDLCPDTLCPPERAAFGAWLAGVMRDLAIVYLTVVLPNDLAAPLPPVTQTWNDFAANAASETFGDRWQTALLDDRRETVLRFIAAINATAQPMLHFLHVLLPHDPFLYLPTGQQSTFQRHNVGLREGRWSDDRWAAALNYHRYLLQVRYVDTLLGKLVARLREVGIYDDALVVITADHGASLQPSLSFRQPEDYFSFVDIAQVPLFIKQPAQRQGDVVDVNVEVIDIVPTLAAELGIALPWSPDGANVLDPAHAPRPSKVVFYAGASRQMEVNGDLRAGLIENAARKFEWFATDDLLDATPTPDRRYGDLIGRAAAPLRATRRAEFEVVVDTLPLLRDVDPQADFVPAHLTGAVAGLSDGAPAPTLAIALNGVVVAVTRPYAFPVVGRREAWEAIIHPRWLVQGPNTLEVFEIRANSSEGAVTLATTRGDTAADRWPNLIRDEEIQALGVQASGFYGMEWAGARPFRWTRGDARLLVPLDSQVLPSSLAINVAITDGPKQLTVAVDGCTLFEQTISGRWSATFDLGDCHLEPPVLEIMLLSDTRGPRNGDTRALGVGVSVIELRRPPR